MSPERWRAIKQVLHRALQVKPEERPEFLARACAADEPLRREVENLLAENVSSGFLEPADSGPEDEPEDPDLVGTVVSNYRVLRRIGRGGMGVVYEAEDLRLHRHVALKFLSRRMADDNVALRRFEREAQAASALNHPNICTVHAVEEHDGRPVIVLELLEGESLRDRMGRGPLSPVELPDFAIQAFEGLEAAHEKGIIHRDIKPGNLFLVAGGRVKILDFGIAKAPALSDEPLTAESVVPGTTAYMAPEQMRGEEVDGSSDLYAMGVVLYEAVTGQRPVLPAELILPSRVNPALPVGFDAIVAKLLAKDRAARYRNARDVCSDLKRLKSGLGSRRPAVAAALSAVAILAIGAVALHYRSVGTLTEKDTIVLADFQNTTGDAVFDDTLKQALAVHLEQSPFLNVLSDENVNATLRRMGRQPGGRLTVEVARDLCQRAGSKALLSGSIASLGSQYVIGLQAIECSGGDSLAKAQTQAAGKERVLKAVGEAADVLRRKLGESLASVRKHDTALEQATTPSLEALKAYSAGWKAQLHGDTESIPFYQRAIELDPGFALAYSQIAMPYANTGQMKRASAAIERAFALREHVTEHERFRIGAYYYSLVTGEIQESEGVYELWRQEYPNDLIPYVELTNNYMVLGQWERALQEAQAAVRIDAHNVYVWFNLAVTYLALSRLEEAKDALDRAQALNSETYLVRLERYYAAVLGADRPFLARQALAADGADDWILNSLSDSEAYSGRLAKARDYSQRAFEYARDRDAKETAALWLANAALHEAELGQAPAATRQARAALAMEPGPVVSAMAGLVMARAGHTGEARQVAETLARDFPKNTVLQSYWLPAIRAASELANKNGQRAVELLRPAAAYELAQSQPLLVGTMYPPYLRGQAFLLLGKGDEAVREFRKVTEHSGVVLNCPVGALVHLGLGRAYALQGDMAGARSAYQGFLRLWKDADPDIPVLRQAKVESGKLER